VNLSEAEWQFLKAADGNQTRSVREILQTVDLDLAGVRSLQSQQLILLSPAQ
jgi:hypothetical protein